MLNKAVQQHCKLLTYHRNPMMPQKLHFPRQSSQSQLLFQSASPQKRLTLPNYHMLQSSCSSIGQTNSLPHLLSISLLLSLSLILRLVLLLFHQADEAQSFQLSRYSMILHIYAFTIHLRPDNVTYTSLT